MASKDKVVTENEKVELFVSLLAKHDRSLGIYVISLCPNLTEAEDVIQDVKLFMWKNFDKFTPGTSFVAWAKKIAFYTVLSHRKKTMRQPMLLGDEFIQAVADDVEKRQEELEKRHARLGSCIKKLSGREREMLILRYTQRLDIEKMAEILSRTVAAVYRHLSRIRLSLHDCVTREEVLHDNQTTDG
jgi:RNA polymerase sigma-70 factor (ECF subfamily)